MLGGLLGGGSSGSPGTAAKGMNTAAVVAALGPLLAKLLKSGGLSKMVSGAQASGLSAQADSWVGTGANAPVSGQEVRSVVGDDTVTELAQKAGITDDEAADVLAHGRPAGRERAHAGRERSPPTTTSTSSWRSSAASGSRNSPRATTTAEPPTSTASIVAVPALRLRVEDRRPAHLDALLEHDLLAPGDRAVAGEMARDRPCRRPRRGVLTTRPEHPAAPPRARARDRVEPR